MPFLVINLHQGSSKVGFQWERNSKIHLLDDYKAHSSTVRNAKSQNFWRCLGWDCTLQRHRCGGGSQQCRLCWTHALGKTPFKPPTTEPLEMTHPFPWCLSRLEQQQVPSRTDHGRSSPCCSGTDFTPQAGFQQHQGTEMSLTLSEQKMGGAEGHHLSSSKARLLGKQPSFGFLIQSLGTICTAR